jgi:diguanylate cyclase (GGDEF)-like protein
MAGIDRLISFLAAAAVGAACDRIVTHRTVERLHQQLSATAHRADHDRLTGLLNRGGLEGAYNAGSGTARSLLIVDLDAFKAVNDRYGHPTGDLVLAALGARIQLLLHEVTGIAGRLGGDEFAVIIAPRTDTDVDEIAAGLAAPITVTGPNGVCATVSASIGVTAAPPATPITHALAQADIALYQAKRCGRPVVYRSGMTYPALPWLRRHARDHDTRARSAYQSMLQRRRVMRRRHVDTGKHSSRPT